MTKLPKADGGDRTVWTAEVRADNVVLLALRVHPDGSGEFGRGSAWLAEGLECSQGNTAPDEHDARLAVIEHAAEMLREGLENLQQMRARAVAKRNQNADRGPRPDWLKPGGRVEVYDRERGPCPLCGEPVEDHKRHIAGYRSCAADDPRGSTIYALNSPCAIRASVRRRKRLADLEAREKR